MFLFWQQINLDRLAVRIKITKYTHKYNMNMKT